MGYLQDFRAMLEKKVADLEEEHRKNIINFASNACLESYKNGLKASKTRTKNGQGGTTKRAPGRRDHHGA